MKIECPFCGTETFEGDLKHITMYDGNGRHCVVNGKEINLSLGKKNLKVLTAMENDLDEIEQKNYDAQQRGD